MIQDGESNESFLREPLALNGSTKRYVSEQNTLAKYRREPCSLRKDSFDSPVYCHEPITHAYPGACSMRFGSLLPTQRFGAEEPCKVLPCVRVATN